MAAQRTRRLRLESLETRSLMSGDGLTGYLPLARPGIAGHSATEETPLIPSSAMTAESPVLQKTRRAFMTTSDSSEWDWLADTNWYVPVENLLAYGTPPDLSDPTPIGDQTLWYINESVNGRISGVAIVKLSASTSENEMPFTGVVTRDGQIRIEFLPSGQSPITGIGQMRFFDGAWRMQMQMATASTVLVTHWAYMSQGDEDTVPPDAGEPLVSSWPEVQKWSWLEGSTWAITDQLLFGKKAHTGVFTIDTFENGYFWGSGQGKQPFNVLGSVTPEGNLLLLVSVNGAAAQSRTGQIAETDFGGAMILRTYEGKPATGAAWSIDVADGINGAMTRYSSDVQGLLYPQGLSKGAAKKDIKKLSKELKPEIANYQSSPLLIQPLTTQPPTIRESITPDLPSTTAELSPTWSSIGRQIISRH